MKQVCRLRGFGGRRRDVSEDDATDFFLSLSCCKCVYVTLVDFTILRQILRRSFYPSLVFFSSPPDAPPAAATGIRRHEPVSSEYDLEAQSKSHKYDFLMQ